MSPLSAAMRMEKEVSRLCSGFLAATRGKHWESVMMSLGGALNAASAPSRPWLVVLTTVHFKSSKCRMVRTWGKISRPLGAWMS